MLWILQLEYKQKTCPKTSVNLRGLWFWSIVFFFQNLFFQVSLAIQHLERHVGDQIHSSIIYYYLEVCAPVSLQLQAQFRFTLSSGLHLFASSLLPSESTGILQHAPPFMIRIYVDQIQAAIGKAPERHQSELKGLLSPWDWRTAHNHGENRRQINLRTDIAVESPRNADSTTVMRKVIESTIRARLLHLLCQKYV